MANLKHSDMLALQGITPEQEREYRRGSRAEEVKKMENKASSKSGGASKVTETKPAPQKSMNLKGNLMKAGQSAGIQQVQQGGNDEQMVGGALMASGNPYAMAAGLGLSVIGQAKERERKAKEAEVKARIEQQARLAQALGNFGSGIGSIG